MSESPAHPETAPFHPDDPIARVVNWIILLLLVAATGYTVWQGVHTNPAEALKTVDKMFTLDTLTGAVVTLGAFGLFVWLCQQTTDGSFQPLGLPTQLTSASAISQTLLAGLGLFVVLSFLLPSLANSIAASLGGMLEAIHPDILAGSIPDLPTLFLAIVIAVIAGGIREELWRTAVLRAFERVGGDQGLVLGIGLSALAFGAVHWYQGPIAVGSTTVMGVWLALRWRKKRDLIDLMTIHAVFNICALVLLYVMGQTPL